MAERWLSPEQASRRIGCVGRQVRRLCAQGVLGAVDVRSSGSRLARWRIPESGLERFLSERREITGLGGHALKRGAVHIRVTEEGS